MQKRTNFAVVAITVVILNLSFVWASPILTSPVERLALELTHPENIKNIDETFWQSLQQKIEDKITSASIELPPKLKPGVSYKLHQYDRLVIHLDILKMEEENKIIFYSASHLLKWVPIQKSNQQVILWHNKTPLTITEIKNASAEIEKAVLNQTDLFLKACTLACAAKTESTNNKDIKFVSSKNSKIFHKIDCSSAKRIKSANKIFYTSKSQAIEAGKRPCKKCNP